MRIAGARRGGDPRQAAGFEVFADAGAGEQAPIADHDHAVERETLVELLHLGTQRAGIGGVAFEDLDRDRASVPVAEQREDDLGLARLAVLGVPAPGEGAFRALEVDRGHVAQDEGTVFEVLFGQPSLDALLPFEQPIHGGVQLVGARLLDSEFLAEGVGRGLA